MFGVPPPDDIIGNVAVTLVTAPAVGETQAKFPAPSVPKTSPPAPSVFGNVKV